jgi:hypothetical protein
MFSIFHPMWIKLGTKDLHKKLTDYEFCKNRHSEKHALMRGINKLLSKLSTFIL